MPASSHTRTPITTYVPPEVAEQIDNAATADGRSRSSWVRMQILQIIGTDAVSAAADEAPPLTDDQAAVLAAAGLTRRKAS